MSVVVLSGGVGGAKLVHGLTLAMDPRDIVAVVNTGDDFRHMGLFISPDIDTVLYTLSGKANRAQGWGREAETWTFMDAARSLGAEDWFKLGDGDLALHILRTDKMRRGETLSAITQSYARGWGIAARILPMSDDPIATILSTEDGELEFQDYFVRRRCAPRVSGIRFAGAERAAPAPGVLDAIADASAILLAPSNPFLSLDPILAVPGLREALLAARAPVVAVSPIIGGKAVKGPTAKLMQEMNTAVDNTAIADHFGDLLDGLVIDRQDQPPQRAVPTLSVDTLMTSDPDRERVARAALELAQRCAAA